MSGALSFQASRLPAMRLRPRRLEQSLRKIRQIYPPVAPDVPAVRLDILIRIAVLIEIRTQFHVLLIEEIILADSYIIEFQPVLKLPGHLGVEISYCLDMWNEWNPPIDRPAMARPDFFFTVL